MTKPPSAEPRPPADAAVRAYLTTTFDRNILVEAGAGSGKTYSLAMRMAAGIEAGHYAVEHIAAVTFTRKAASELRGRFQSALEERLRSAPTLDARARLETALSGIERLFAGTIHAFCAHLLRERPVDARMAPGFVELDDVQDGRLRRRAWRDYVASARASGSAPLLELLDADVRPKDLDKAFATICEHEDVTFDPGTGTIPDPAPVWTAFDALWRELVQLRPTTFEPETTCTIQKRWDEYAGRRRRAKPDRAADLAGLLRAWGHPKPVQKYWGGTRSQTGTRVVQRVERFTDEVAEPWLQRWRAYVYRLAIHVLTDAREAYARERRRLNVVNYVDLLRVTARLLREAPDVRRALQQKYRWLFIDEFQDTDPIQAEIFLHLAADDESGGLRPGALFVVGDPKQSIYRFRRADIDIYNRVASLIVETGGEVLSLTANFRSRPAVCTVANTVFPRAFEDFDPRHSPRYTPLDPVRADALPARGRSGAPQSGVAVLPVPCTGNRGADKAAAVAAEAERIAAYVQAEVAAGRRRYGDFLVLTRQRPRLEVYATAFDNLDIPVEVSGAGLFCASPEVRALAQVLRALADPLDAVTLVGVLRGPLFGISDPALFQFVQAGGRLELHGPLPEADGEPDDDPAEVIVDEPERTGQLGLPLSSAPRATSASALLERFGPAWAALRTLRGWWRLTRRLPLAAAVDRILEESGWLALAATTPGGARAGHLLQAIDEVRQVVEAGGGLADAAVAIEEAEGEASTESEAWPLEPGRLDVVRLMNIHKAKGLEAPVVVLADPLHGYTFDAQVRIERTADESRGHLSITTVNDKHVETVLAQPIDWDTHAATEQPYLDAERCRILYVAATRACDLLIVSRADAPGKNTAWGIINSVLDRAPAITSAAATAAAHVLGRGVTPTARAAAVARRVAREDHLRAPSWSVASPSIEKSRLYAAARARALVRDEADTDVGDSPAHRVDAGAAWGSLLHGLLEHAMRHAGASRADLTRLAQWLTVEHEDLRPFIPEALDWVDRVQQMPFWHEAAAAGGGLVEVPFAVRIDDGGTPVLRRGIIDLVFQTATGWQIVDYKTDLVDADADADAVLRARHETQLTEYADAWRRATGEPVSGCAVVSLRTGRTVGI